LFGTYRRLLDTFFNWPGSFKVFKVLYSIASKAGPVGMRALLPIYDSPLSYEIGRRAGLFDRYYAQRHDMDKYMEHLMHMNPQVFLRMVDAIADHDLSDVLPELYIPSLVVAGEHDKFTPVHCSERMAELLPISELIVLTEASHAAVVEQPEIINSRIERFLRDHTSAS
jgi:pimeloyl-ACP methyl ester carboxylesterase